MYVSLYVCLFVCLFVCMYVCIFIFIDTYMYCSSFITKIRCFSEILFARNSFTKEIEDGRQVTSQTGATGNMFA